VTEQIHLIVRLSDDGAAYATSPQAPGLLYGRSSLKELHHDLEDVLSFHFERPGPFAVVEHHERHQYLAGGELVTRLAMDEQQAERVAVYERIGRVIGVPGQAESLLSAVTNPVGEAVYVCAVPSDTFGWLVAQLDPRGDAFVAALTIADELLLALPFAVEDGTRPAWRPSSYAPETRLSEIMQRSPIVTPPQMARLELC
jgi:hypothetical protein